MVICLLHKTFVILQKPGSLIPDKTAEKKPQKKVDLSEAEKETLAQSIFTDLMDDVITSDTTQPSVPGVVLDTINDIIMGEVALAKEEVAKEKEEKLKENEKLRREEEKRKKDEEKRRKEDEKKKKRQPASPAPVVSPTSPTSPEATFPSQQQNHTNQEIETQEAKLDLRSDEEAEHRLRKTETPQSLPADLQHPMRHSSQTEPNITINGQNLPQEPIPVVLNGHVVTGRQGSRDSGTSSSQGGRRSGSHTPTSPTTPTPRTAVSPTSEDLRPQYTRTTSQDSKRSSGSTTKVCAQYPAHSVCDVHC